jgi:hypothetical protein
VDDVPPGALAACVCGVVVETSAALASLPADTDAAVVAETTSGETPQATLRSDRSSRGSIDNRRLFFFFNIITQLLV